MSASSVVGAGAELPSIALNSTSAMPRVSAAAKAESSASTRSFANAPDERVGPAGLLTVVLAVDGDAVRTHGHLSAVGELRGNSSLVAKFDAVEQFATACGNDHAAVHGPDVRAARRISGDGAGRRGVVTDWSLGPAPPPGR